MVAAKDGTVYTLAAALDIAQERDPFSMPRIPMYVTSPARCIECIRYLTLGLFLLWQADRWCFLGVGTPMVERQEKDAKCKFTKELKTHC